MENNVSSVNAQMVIRRSVDDVFQFGSWERSDLDLGNV